MEKFCFKYSCFLRLKVTYIYIFFLYCSFFTFCSLTLFYDSLSFFITNNYNPFFVWTNTLGAFLLLWSFRVFFFFSNGFKLCNDFIFTALYTLWIIKKKFNVTIIIIKVIILKRCFSIFPLLLLWIASKCEKSHNFHPPKKKKNTQNTLRTKVFK